MKFRWKRVTSSVINAIAYDMRSMTLGIRFRSRAIYAYTGVEPETYQAFLRAASKGKFFGREIRNQYEFERIA